MQSLVEFSQIVLEEEEFQIPQYFSLFCCYLHDHLKEHESPLPKDACAKFA